jgi:AraC-like DNA-binding protein
MRLGNGTSSRRNRRVLAIMRVARRDDVGTAMSAAVIGALRSTSDVVAAQSAADALRRLSNSRAFDVAVMDCSAEPGGDEVRCIELIELMWRRYPWLPVVLIGRAPGERLRADVLLTGVRDFLTNDVSPGKLVRSITRAARRHGARVPRAANVATIQRVFAFLDEHMGDGLSLRDLARMAQMSRSHLSRTFHSVAGMPLRGYIRELRLKRAHALLVRGDLSLTAVAVESGFYDLPHFDKAFRRRLGVSPRAFRARYRRLEGQLLSN